MKRDVEEAMGPQRRKETQLAGERIGAPAPQAE
jgi:hypothetical protein